MCGRYRLSHRKQIIEEYFDASDWQEDWSPRFNIAPMQPVPVIRPASFHTPPSPHSICISPAPAAPAASFWRLFRTRRLTLLSAFRTHPGVASEKAL